MGLEHGDRCSRGIFLVGRIEESVKTIFQHAREKIEIVKVGSHLFKTRRWAEGMFLCL